jgi:hypothetical protein
MAGDLLSGQAADFAQSERNLSFWRQSGMVLLSCSGTGSGIALFVDILHNMQ